MFFGARFFRDKEFKQQLNLAVGVGIVVFAIVSSQLTSWQGGQEVRRTLLEQGERIAVNLASQSTLALLYASAENANEVVKLTLSFPDVTRVEIRHTSGKPLLVRGKSVTEGNDSLLVDTRVRQAYLESETGDEWRFVAPVLSKSGDSPFEVAERQEEFLGFVRVVQSKATLSHMLARIFLANLMLALIFAATFLYLLRQLASRLTRPITELSEVMTRAEHGETSIRADVSGPKDIRDMATAFNSMIVTLHEREQALRESVTFQNSLLDAMPIPVFYKDREGRYLGFNRAYETFFGATNDQLIGKTAFDISPRELAEIYHAKDTELFESGGIQQYESQVKNTHGLLHDVIFTKAVFSDSRGSIGGLIGTILDITERKRMEQERLVHLQFVESLDRVNRAIQGANDLEKTLRDVLQAVLTIFDCDRAWLFYPCDPDAPSFRVPMEVAKPEYPGAGILNTDVPMPPDMAQNLREALESADPVTYIVGTGRPINQVSAEQFGVKSMMLAALYPQPGKPWAFGLHQCAYPRAWTAEDQRLFQEIGRRLADGLTGLLSHRDLQESEAKYRRIIDTANEGIWMLGPDTMTTFVNARMTEMLGYSADEMIDRPVTDFMFAEDAPEHLIKMEQRRQGVSDNYERRYRRKDGRTVWTLASAAPIFDGKHQFMGSFAMFTDITERKQAEEELKRANTELERQTLALTRTNADLQRFAEVTAHHLQEPARRMATYAIRLTKHIGDRLDDAEAKLSLEFINQQARQQQALLRDVERFLASDQPRGKIESIDARQTVARILTRLKDRIREAGAEITVDNLPPSRIDLPRLDDAFSIVLDNALIHGRCEHTLRIRIEGELQDGKALYSISDNGPGVEAQYRERVFRVFERLTSDDHVNGTGIGLAILRRIAESCDGRAWIEETPGGGCRVLFELPVGEPH
ncbi:MAG: PAS domain S-box protein [Betaproteobacteria bacterium]|nr:PAS domain S-box protein [Betaproteobacteria bacterium]